MQEKILEHYSKQSCTIIIFDLDHKVTAEDEERLRAMTGNGIMILETAIKPKEGIIPRISIEIPFWMKDSTLPLILQPSPYKDLVYIGSRYERDDVINEYLIPFSERSPFTTWFYSNWRNYGDKYEELYVDLKWRDIQYHGRVGHTDFRSIYGDALACPLLAKRDYFEHGFMTARIQEALYFGTIPIGFREHLGIEKYLPYPLIAEDSNQVFNIVQQLKAMTIEGRNCLRQSI